MRFLKTLFWIVVAVLITFFAVQNWRDVTINLWGNLQADIKVPVLLLIAFLIGFRPTWMIYRAKIWRLANHVSIPHREHRAAVQEEPVEPE